MRLWEIAQQLRGLVRRGVVKSTNDHGESQTVSGTMYKGHDFADVELLFPSGFSSRPPKNGLVLLFAVGGDGGDLVGLPVASPGNRMGGLNEAETVIFNPLNGSRVHIKADGTIHAWSTVRVLAQVGEAEIDLTADLARMRLGTGEDAPRMTVTSDLVKMRKGSDWVVVSDGQITVSRPPVVGPDPDPSV